jgi:hypothetical protein
MTRLKAERSKSPGFVNYSCLFILYGVKNLQTGRMAGYICANINS